MGVFARKKNDWSFGRNKVLKLINFTPGYGFIILIHLGTDPRRPDHDKFYDLLPEMMEYLMGKGYEFKRVDHLLN